MGEAGSTSESVLRIAGGELRQAPRRVRVLFGAAVLYMVATLGWAVHVRGWQALQSLPFYGAVLGAASGLLLGLTFGLFTMAQEGEACVGWFRVRVRARRMHPMMLALPVLSTAAVLCAATSFGLLLPLAPGRPAVWAALAAPALVVVFALDALVLTTRFLYRHAEEQAERAARAQEQATRAQLAALQAQMHPHFLFNALNTVASLVRTDGRRAEATVENLARVLRRSLDRARQAFVPLDVELEDLRAYLAIEQERFGERLTIAWDVDREALACRVPPMTLQPLVENSLKHGLSQRLDGGTIRIGAARSNGSLHLRVADDGPGFAVDARDGTGLGNLRRRLETLYGGAARLTKEPGPGAAVTLELPADAPARP